MRKVVSLILALMLCLAVAAPAYASVTDYVPSITYKPVPPVVDVEGADGIDGCIVVTSVKQAKENKTDITQDERDLLLDVYDKLSKGTMRLPLDYDHVVRYLVDVNWEYNDCRQKDHGHKEWHDEDDTAVTVKFNIGVSKSEKVDVLAYIDGEWVKVETTNLGSGIISCKFEEFCPVAFCLKATAANTPAPKTGDAMGNQLGLWIGLMGGAAALIAVLVVVRRKRK